jgi:hypothetical protein
MGGQSVEAIMQGLLQAQLFVPQVQRAEAEANQAKILQALKQWELDLSRASGRVYPTGFGSAILQKIDPQTGNVTFEAVGPGRQRQGQPSELSELERMSQVYTPQEYERILEPKFGPRQTWGGKEAEQQRLSDIKTMLAESMAGIKKGGYESKERHGQRMGEIKERTLERTGEQRVKNMELIGQARAKLQGGRKAVGTGKLAERTIDALDNMEAAMAAGQEPSSIDKALVEKFLYGVGGGEAVYQKEGPFGPERGTTLKGGKAAQFRETADDWHDALEESVQQGKLTLPGAMSFGGGDLQAQLDKIRAKVRPDERLAFDEAVRRLKERHNLQ